MSVCFPRLFVSRGYLAIKAWVSSLLLNSRDLIVLYLYRSIGEEKGN